MKINWKKISAIGAGIIVAGSLAWAGIAQSNANHNAIALQEAASTLSMLGEENVALNNQVVNLNNDLISYGVTIDNLTTIIEDNQAVMDDYAEELANLQAELETATEIVDEPEVIVTFNGYEDEFAIANFDLGVLTDNQFEKLGDYKVDFDGDSVDVNEFLSVKGTFETEDEVAMTFDNNDVVYRVEFDTGLDFDEDSLTISFLGEDVEITNIGVDSLTFKGADSQFGSIGDVINGVEIVNIGQDAVMIKSGVETEVIHEDETVKINDLEVSLEELFYTEDNNSMVSLRVGTDIDQDIEVGDYFDEAENWEYTTITDGVIELTLTEEVEAVQELVLPNDFATISFSLSDEDYNDVELSKDDGVFSDLRADFENYDATKVEFNGSVWIIEDDNGDDLIVDSLLLKDSDYSVDFNGGLSVMIGGVNVTPNAVDVSGDDDELFFTSNGVIVGERDDWDEEDDDSVVVSVPEEAVEAIIKVE